MHRGPDARGNRIASSLLCVTDPRGRDPFAKYQPEQISLEELVRAFLEIRTPEMTTLLAVIAELAHSDDLLRRRIRRELASRPRVEPHWIAELAQSVTHRAVR